MMPCLQSTPCTFPASLWKKSYTDINNRFMICIHAVFPTPTPLAAMDSPPARPSHHIWCQVFFQLLGLPNGSSPCSTSDILNSDTLQGACLQTHVFYQISEIVNGESQKFTNHSVHPAQPMFDAVGPVSKDMHVESGLVTKALLLRCKSFFLLSYCRQHAGLTAIVCSRYDRFRRRIP